MHVYQEKRYRLMIILFSLCINMLLLVPVLLVQFDGLTQEIYVFFDTDDQQIQTQEQLEREQEELIEYILSAGSLPVQTDDQFQQDLQAQEQNALVDTIENGRAIESEEKSQDHEEELAQLQEPDMQHVVDALAQTALVKAEKERADLTKLPESEQKKIEKKIVTKKTLKQESFGLSLGQITQGFLKSVQQEEGLNNPPQMDADRLAAHQYATRVWNIIKNSFLSDQNMLHLSHNIDTMAYLVITIAQQGNLIDIHLEANKITPAFRQIEEMICTHAKKAGLFPPLPKRFSIAQKTFTFPLHIQGQEGFHTYRLSYGPHA